MHLHHNIVDLDLENHGLVGSVSPFVTSVHEGEVSSESRLIVQFSPVSEGQVPIRSG